MEQLCHLEEAVGREVSCPEERCEFWDGECAVAMQSAICRANVLLPALGLPAGRFKLP